jgi:hypothetical protein
MDRDDAAAVARPPASPSAVVAPSVLPAPRAVPPPDAVVRESVPAAAPAPAAPSSPGGAADARGPAASLEATAAPDGIRDEEAVRRVLHDYVTAYRELDVDAAAQVWPSVDRRALSRAFSTLKSQELEFETCDVKTDGSDAVVRCRGKLRYVQKIGASTRRTSQQQWLFEMEKLGAAWKIGRVTASN